MKRLTKLGFLLLLLGVYFYIYTLLITRSSYNTLIKEFPEVNLLEIMPITFWFTLGFIMFSTLIFVKTDSRKMMLSSLLILTIVILCTPLFLEPNARIYDSYWHYSSSEHILDTGEIRPEDRIYQSYPGSFLFGTIFSGVISLNGLTFLRFIPLLFVILLFLSLYLLASYFSKKSTFFLITMLVFLTGYNQIQTHFSPQAFAVPFFILFLYALLKFKKEPVIKNGLLMSIFFVFCTLTHPITGLILVLILIVLFFKDFIINWKNRANNLSKISMYVYLFLIGVFFLVGGTVASDHFLMAISNVISRFSDIWINDTAQQVTVSYVYLSPNPIYRYGRIFIYSLFLFTGSLGFLRLYLYKKETFLEIVCWVIGIGLFIIFTIFYSQGLWFERGLLYLFVPLALIISFVQHPFPMTRNFNEKNIIYRIKAKVGKKYKFVVSFLLGVVILSAPIACYFGYAEELPKIVPTSEVRSAEWVTNFAYNGSYLAHKTDAVISYYKPTAETLSVESWSWTSKTSFDEAFFTPPYSVNSIITTKQFYGNYYPDYSNIISNLNNNKTLNRVYSNDFVLIYHTRSE